MEGLMECCAVDCDQAGEFHILIEHYNNGHYGYTEIRAEGSVSMEKPPIDTYYCKKHLTEKLNAYVRRFQS